jgi:transposase
MIGPPPGTRVYLACGVTDMRRGFDSLSAQVEGVLNLDPYGGAVFIFRGRRGDLLKALHWDGQGLVLYAKRLEKGRFVWPQAKEGTVSLTAAQLSMLVEGIDWRQPVWTARPQTEIQV